MDESIDMTGKGVKSKRILLFALAAGIIIFLTAFLALQGEEEWISDPYGSTSDDWIIIQEGQEIRTVFTIEKDGFQGIEIKLLSEVREFGNEKLLFSMIDNSTGQLISEYTLPLHNVICQVGVFVPLPFPDSKGKEVTVLITGTDIHSVPSLYIGEKASSARPSRLFFEDLEDEEHDLVFSAVYLEKSPINIQNLLKGILYLILLAAAFFWSGSVRQTAAAWPEAGTAGTAGAGKRQGKGTAAKVIWFLVGSVLIGGLALFVYKNNLEELVGKKLRTEVSALDEDTDQKLVLSSDRDILEHAFASGKNGLSAVCYTVAVKNPDPEAAVRVQIFDGKGNICYQDMTVKVSELPQDAAPWNIPFKKVYKESKDVMVLVRMIPLGFVNTEMEFSPGMPVAKSLVKVRDMMRGFTPALTVTFHDNDWIRPLFVIWTALIYGFFLLCWFLIVCRGYTIEKVYIPVALWLGLMYLLIIPIYSIPDEYTHVDTAYAISNRLLGIRDPENMKGYAYKRECDIETEEYLTYEASLEDYRRLYYEMGERVGDQELVLCTVRSGAAHVNILYYLPAAIGMAIGRVLSLGILPVLLLGRFMNLLCFTLLTYLALRRLGKQRMLLGMIALLPITLQQAASYSYDCILIAVALLFTAYCFYFAFEAKSVSVLDMMLFAFTFAQIAYVKGGCYLPLCLLVLMIPLERGWKWGQAAGFTLTSGLIACGFFAQGNVISLLKNYFFKNAGSVNPLSGSEMYTFGYLIHHPFKLISLFVNTVFVHGSRLVYEMFGGKMGSLFNIQMPWLYIIGFITVITVTCSLPSVQFRIRNKLTKALMILTVLGATGLLFLSMLLADTAKTMNTVQGLQGRYFIPVLFLPLVLLGDVLRSRLNFDSHDSSLSMGYSCLHMAFLFSIIMVVFPNM